MLLFLVIKIQIVVRVTKIFSGTDIGMHLSIHMYTFGTKERKGKRSWLQISPVGCVAGLHIFGQTHYLFFRILWFLSSL